MDHANAVALRLFMMLAIVTGAGALGCLRTEQSTPVPAESSAKAVADASVPEAKADSKEPDSTTVSVGAKPAEARLPRLLDLGAGKCIPCKMMAPILEELKKEYAGTFDVEFADVWKDPQAAEKHGIDTIPTQIFFDASGKERFRHVGFFSKEEILAKWKELGVEKGT